MYERSGGSKKTRVFKIYITIPDGVREDEVMDYIEDAVCGHKDTLHQQHPLRQLDEDRVSVKRATAKYKDMKITVWTAKERNLDGMGS